MAKYRVAVIGTVGKSVLIDDSLSSRVAALEAQITTAGGVTAHSALTGLQQGDDHPQYTMWQAPETIKALWNFEQEPDIEGVSLTEFIEDVVGGELVQDTVSIHWAYGDTAGTLEANVQDEYVQDVVGAMAIDSTSIDFTYDDPAGTLTAAVNYANATASVGLTAVNGIAATAMRSDAAPKLDVSISPTWSGTHTFNNTPVVPNDSWTYAKIQNVSATSRVLGRISSGAGNIEELTGANLLTILSAAGLSAANPMASVGLSAVNGSATTYMRSDGAPALSQSISPTWTGTHTFSTNTTIWDFPDNTYALSVRGATGRFLVRPYINSTFGVGFEATNTAQTLNIPLSLIGDPVRLYNGSTESARVDGSSTADDTRLLLYDVSAGAVVRVTRGATDSGGTGFRVLRIPN